MNDNFTYSYRAYINEDGFWTESCLVVRTLPDGYIINYPVLRELHTTAAAFNVRPIPPSGEEQQRAIHKIQEYLTRKNNE